MKANQIARITGDFKMDVINEDTFKIVFFNRRIN